MHSPWTILMCSQGLIHLCSLQTIALPWNKPTLFHNDNHNLIHFEFQSSELLFIFYFLHFPKNIREVFAQVVAQKIPPPSLIDILVNKTK